MALKRKSLKLEEKIIILDKIHSYNSTKSYRELSNILSVPRSTIACTDGCIDCTENYCRSCTIGYNRPNGLCHKYRNTFYKNFKDLNQF
ncbi:hypothetical protein A3Q56_02296 [Intoshia linei]|uniref:Uncharacterized protein n=1 Tax=Intoshia linei TaxID=1819745 RepID=A0A177B8I3_9BILA|nr:hypothetical protein A3Q56_02296 [Intoshia linei]